MNLTELLNENYDNQQAFVYIANTVITSITGMAVRYIKNGSIIINAPVGKFFNSFADYTEISLLSIPITDLPDSVQPFIKKSRVDVGIGYRDSGSTRGAYSTVDKSIKLIFNQYEVLQLQHDLTKYDDTYNIVYNFLHPALSTLVHELTHAYDDFMSNGKAIKLAKSYVDDQEDISAYLTQPHEINARYYQTISSIPGWVSFSEYKVVFIKQFRGWELLSPTTQKRLLSRLGAAWQESSKKLDVIAPPALSELRDNIFTTYDTRLFIEYNHQYKIAIISGYAPLSTSDSVLGNILMNIAKWSDQYQIPVGINDVISAYQDMWFTSKNAKKLQIPFKYAYIPKQKKKPS